ncbi:receptor-type tyrosine-protein phosphatase eta isoform X3 [Mastacembelus armatus]|uniref:receptor-type tyrosine-protein phosphatase eta isoform X3 n=1 Tax=Mastacembelus armatus TaxID=205130 RepID=UPI000E454C6D|nr:receptor-type tyrosine-protein phosphatase eta-like isoform X3 [Mastacembelus armatus]
MRPPTGSSVALWALLVFSAVLRNSQADVCRQCYRNETSTLTTTTTKLELGSNCIVTINNTTVNNSTSGLIAGAVYQIFLICSNCCTSVTMKPEVVRNLAVTEFTTSSVSLSWTEPEGNSSFYILHWTNGNVRDTANVTETFKNITNLTAGVQYNISVTAVADDGYTEGQKTSVSQYTRPGIISYTSVSKTSSSISLNWTSPVGQVSMYMVQWNNGGVPVTKYTNDTFTVLSDLIPGTSYTITIIAVAGDNKTQGDPYALTSFTRPGIISYTSVSKTSSSISLNWTSPVGQVSMYMVQWNNGGVPVTKYTNDTFTVLSDLIPGTSYTITIIAVAGDNKTQGDPYALTSFTRPGIISYTSVSQTSSSISLNWTSPVGQVSMYMVQWNNGGVPVTKYTNDTFTVLSDLIPGTSYTITIIAVAGNNTTQGDPYTLTSFTKPSVVKNLTVTYVTTASVTLNWIKPDGNATLYIVRWTSAENVFINTTNTSYTINGLTSGFQYNIRVAAVSVNSSNEGERALITTFTRPGIISYTSVSQTSSSISLNWTSPVGQVFMYMVQWSNGGVPVTKYTNDTFTVLSDLIPGTSYTITIIAVAGNNITQGDPYALTSFTKPSVVKNLTVTYVTTASVTLNWIKPDGNATLYIVRWTSAENVFINTTNTSYTINGLTSGFQYNIRVAAVSVNSSNEGERALITTFTKPEVVSNISVIGSTTNLSVSWIKAMGQVHYYTVYLYRDKEPVSCDNCAIDLSNTTVNNLLWGLEPGVFYCVVVGTKSGLFESNSSSVCNATSPNPPGPITVVSQSVESINFTWPLPVGMNYPYYNFSVSTVNGSFRINNNWFLLGNLESGSPYNISVVTVGELNYMSTVVTTQNYTKPCSVTMLTQSKITTNAVTLVWEQPMSKPQYQYVVNVTNDTTVIKMMSNNTTVTITGLLSGSQYSFTVITQTADGTQAAPVSVSYFTRPYGITWLRATTLNTTTVNLSWGKPPDYKAGYTYRVMTAGYGTQNKTVTEDSTQISGLTPGSNFSFCVFVRAVNGSEGEGKCTSQYTYPEIAQPSISNQGSNSSVLVSWTKPLGNVDYYMVLLNRTLSNVTVQTVNSTNTSLLFENLSAGTQYYAMITTFSGPFNASSGFSTTETYPNPPGPINILTKTTSSIHIEWMPAPLMTSASFVYQLNNTPSQGGGCFNTTHTSYTFDSLLSGTSYNISVATVGAMGFMSEKVYSFMVTTRPLSVKSVMAQTTNDSIKVEWTAPDDYKESYRYNLTWQCKLEPCSATTGDTKYNISNLDPGTSYNFSVTTETSDGTQGAPMSSSSCTNANSVKSLTCEGPNATNAKLIMSWNKPSGQSTGFLVTVNNKINKSGCCNYTVSDLRHYTEYTLAVVTESCGQSSLPVPLVCKTGITNPLIPTNYESLSVVQSKDYKSFTLLINPSLLDSTMGPITHVGVLVTDTDPVPNDSKHYLGKTYDQWKSKNTSVYLATVYENLFQSRSEGNTLTINIGSKSSWKGYTNGELEATQKYQYAIAVFTSLTLQNNLVNYEISLVTVTKFYPVFELPQNPAVIGMAVGVTLGIFFIFLFVLIGFIIYWRRSSNKETSDIQIHSMRAKVSIPVRVEDYEAYYKKQKADSNCGFAEEFEDLKLIGTGQLKTSALVSENRPKNRYNNVLPYDSSRVRLSIVHGNPYDDYINANYMPGHNSRKEFIAAQGPLPTTVDEFWRMVWEKNVQTLVMLTRCNEQGRVKCEQYWGSGTKHFENITVTATSEIPLEDWTIRDFSIKNIKTAETRSVRHFHFTAWPDHGVPETTELLISFRHLVREHMDQYSRNSPTVVHCSAGVGRTGTFIAIDRLIFQIERESIVDVFGIVHDLRMHRPLMVQTEDQYVFLNQCAMDIIRSRTGTNVDLIYQNTAALSIYENIQCNSDLPKNRYRNA